jgi:YVTN family beta-propeller protein
VLIADPEDVDVVRFEGLVEAAGAALERLDAEAARVLLASALALWRGPALADVLEVPFAAAAARRLEDQRLVGLEKRIDADLQAGRHRELISELESLTAADPYREPFQRQLILALYRSGRQADALMAHRRARDVLAEEMGIEPSPELRAMEGQVLRQDPVLDPPHRLGPNVAAGNGPSSRHPGKGAEDTARRDRPPARRWSRRSRSAIAAGVVALALIAIAVPVVTRRAGPRIEVPANGIAVLAAGGDLMVDASLDLGGPPGQITAGEGSVWVSSPEARAVYRIDPERRAVVQTISVGAGSNGLVLGVGAAWVANGLDGTVSRIDPGTNEVVDSIDVGSQPTGIAFGEGAVWAADPVSGTLTRIDPSTDRPRRTTGLDLPPFAVAVGDHAVWTTSASANRALSIDPATNRLTQDSEVGAGPTAMAVGYGAVWVANSRDSTVSRIDPATGSVVSTIPVGEGPSGIAIGAGGV